MSTIAKRLLAGLVVLVLVAGAVGAYLLTRKEPTRFSADFSQTVGLYKGSDVRILGVKVGEVTKVEPDGEVVKVEMELDGDQKVAPDTGAVVIAPSVVSDRYVQLTQPWVTGSSIADGTVIPTDKTAVPVELDEIYTSLNDITTALGPNGANKNGALSDLLKVSAKNLKGNGKAINQVIRDLGGATGTLSKSDEKLFATVANLQEFNTTLVDNDRGVAQINQQFAEMTGYLSDDRETLAAALRNLAGALGVVDDFIRENRGALTDSVKKLTTTTQTLVRQRDSLAEFLKVSPLVLRNFMDAYNPEYNVLDGRGNLNELSIWGRPTGNEPTGATDDGGGSGDPSEGASSSGTNAPPLLLPSVGVVER